MTLPLSEAIELLGKARAVPEEADGHMLLEGSNAADGCGSPLTRTDNAFKAIVAASPPQYAEALSAVIEAARMYDYIAGWCDVILPDGTECEDEQQLRAAMAKERV